MRRDVVVGLDHDSRGFHAVLSGYQAPVPWYTFSSKHKNADVRRIDACRNFAMFLESLPAQSHIFAEEPLVLPRNGKTTRLLALMAGALWGQALGHSLFWHWVDVAHWKREVVGKGNANKEQIAEWVRAAAAKARPPERLSVYEATPDLFDAHCLAVYGRRVIPTLELVA